MLVVVVVVVVVVVEVEEEVVVVSSTSNSSRRSSSSRNRSSRSTSSSSSSSSSNNVHIEYSSVSSGLSSEPTLRARQQREQNSLEHFHNYIQKQFHNLEEMSTYMFTQHQCYAASRLLPVNVKKRKEALKEIDPAVLASY